MRLRTVRRFYTLHYYLPIVVVGMVGVHVALLHERGSRTPCGRGGGVDKIPLYPYFILKDVVAWVVVFGLGGCVVLVAPWWLGDPENFLEADALVTPEHIKPEWYFLFAYAILRAVPNKVGGVLGLVGSIVVVGMVGLLEWDDRVYRGYF